MRRMTCVLRVLTFMFVTAATASAGSFFFSTAGFDGYQAKPISVKGVLQTVRGPRRAV
jgi:hypothetical protein